MNLCTEYIQCQMLPFYTTFPSFIVSSLSFPSGFTFVPSFCFRCSSLIATRLASRHSRHPIPLLRMMEMATRPSTIVTPATNVKNGPSPMLSSNGCITATPPAARAQRVMFPAAAAVLGLSRWISTSSVLNVCSVCQERVCGNMHYCLTWFTPKNPMKNCIISGTETCCTGISGSLAVEVTETS
jgi:hypothetical protein